MLATSASASSLRAGVIRQHTWFWPRRWGFESSARS
jgi:hypothetical protein